MKKSYEKIFRNFISNVIIVLVVTVVAVVGLWSDRQSVSSAKLSPIYHGNTNQPNVSLMVNVYWGTEYLDEMLRIFREYQVTTTFFVGGSWAEKNAEALNKIVKDGHEIGNHGYFHQNHKALNYEQNEAEIFNAQSVVEVLSGVHTNLFAPPSGSFCEATLQAAADLGYRTVMWSKDTIDWRDKSSDLIFKRATAKIENGDLVLMHPTADTLLALPRILDFYRQNGFRVVTVSENIR